MDSTSKFRFVNRSHWSSDALPGGYFYTSRLLFLMLWTASTLQCYYRDRSFSYMDYIFKECSGKLTYVGRFDEFYTDEPDPWGQSGRTRIMYKGSRKRQVEIISAFSFNKNSVGLDVGSGLGITTDLFSTTMIFHGCDISGVAVDKAQKLFPSIHFYVLDIRTPPPDALKGIYSVLVLNQLLWYVIDDFPNVLRNARSLLNKNGSIILSNFLFGRDNQKFALEHFQGQSEISKYLEDSCGSNGLFLESYECKRIDDVYYDFHAVIKLK